MTSQVLATGSLNKFGPLVIGAGTKCCGEEDFVLLAAVAHLIGYSPNPVKRLFSYKVKQTRSNP